MEFTGERYVPSESAINDELSVEHLHRYHAILPLLTGKTVLDIACGEGYGTALMATKAQHVLGIDISEGCITHATKKYGQFSPNVNFAVGDVRSIPVSEQSIDVLVSFETIEHIGVDEQHQFLKEIKRVLRSDGVLIMSTPDKANYSNRYGHENHFHAHELHREEFLELISKYFHHVHLMEQGFEVMSAITPADVAGIHETRVLHLQRSTELQQRKYLIAIASNETSQNILSSSIVMECGKNYLKMVDRIMDLQREVEELGAWGTKLDQEQTAKNAIIQTFEKQAQHNLQELSTRIDGYNSELNGLRTALTTLEEKSKVHAQLAEQLNALKSQLALHEQKEVAYRNKINELELERDKLKQVESLLPGLHNQISEKDGLLKDLEFNFSLTRKQLSEVNDRLATIYGSDGWKALASYYQIKGKVLNEDSAHYKLLRKSFNFLRGRPTIIPDNHQRFIPSTSIPSDLNNHLVPAVEIEPPVQSLPVFEHPKVSIVIPVYNAWEMNRQCLESIIINTKDVAYEVILADDCSTDRTKEIDKWFPNIVHVRNEENKGFLLNCNHAASYAKGQYIHFLNNDTQVKPGWLSSLVRLIESDEQVGMVGSKLIYPDGKLQEAGGIIWNDASGWNFGHRQNPEDPAFNYVKEVDYISGASIMVRKELWEKIGGFDTRYSPAYFEDTDLAFEVRAHGYKVMYQPLSEVIHYEGYSHGRDEDAAKDENSVKAYQKINKQKFFDKWAKVLQQEHFNNAEHVFWAKERSSKKPTILVVDHYVPHYDKDAGSRNTFQYLSLFLEMGLNVKFIGDNFFKHEPYTTVLQQMGIEVLHGVYYRDHWQDWVKEHGEKIKYCYLNRPHISIKYIDFIKRNTDAQILYFGHDLHFFRESKEYAVTKKPELLKSINYWKEMETYLFRSSDVILTPSYEEEKVIKEIVPDKKVLTTRLFLYRDFRPAITEFTNRKKIVFVGGFNHTPNTDGVLWFMKEVWPVVKKTLPDAFFTIVGSNAPDSITALASVDVAVLGYVTDEELSKLYKEARLIVVPLRYGAGVKGKVLEAMYHAVPLITTVEGVEGLPGDIDFLNPARTGAEFAELLISIYSSEEKLKRLSVQEHQYITGHFSWQAARQLFEEVLDAETVNQ